MHNFIFRCTYEAVFFRLFMTFFDIFGTLSYRILIFLVFNRQVRTLKRYAHSSYNTTANIYTHVDTESKQNSALVIGNSLNFTEPNQDNDEEDEEMEL